MKARAASAASAASVGAALMALAACRDAPTSATPPLDAASPLEAGVAPTRVASGASAIPAAFRPTRTCRVIGVDGKIRAFADGQDPDAGVPIGITSEARPKTWIDLDPAVKLTTKDSRTGRELHFDGPGRVRPCEAHGTVEEEAWLGRGAFTSTPGTGEAPGQEEWLVTPLAVVRYGSALVKVSVGDGPVTVRTLGGAVSVWVPNGAKTARDPDVSTPTPSDAEGWLRVGAPVSLVVTGPVDARTAIRACASARSAAGDVARAIASATADPTSGHTGELAERHVVLRQSARAACAVAALRTSLADRAARASLDAALDAALRVAPFPGVSPAVPPEGGAAE